MTYTYINVTCIKHTKIHNGCQAIATSIMSAYENGQMIAISTIINPFVKKPPKTISFTRPGERPNAPQSPDQSKFSLSVCVRACIGFVSEPIDKCMIHLWFQDSFVQLKVDDLK